MNPKPHAHSLRPARRSSRGFALLITITLLAFLVLLLVSLATLTRVETQVAGNNQSLSQARQNALMALNLALGQLQKQAGPDRRVTAPADVGIPASVTITGTAATDVAGIDSYWRASRNRHWTGVWKNKKNDPAAYDKDNPAAFNPAPDLLSWLVSGNENTAATFIPSAQVSGLTASSTAVDRILDSAGNPHRLLVKAVAGVTSAGNLDRAVTAPEIEIKAAAPGSGNSDSTVGHYAWWVGDEGVKARVNLVDRFAPPGSGETSAEKLLRETARRQSAQRTASEAMTTTGTDGLAPLDPALRTTSSALAAFNADLLNVFAPNQLAYLGAAPSLPDELKARFHDLGICSRGVLSDVKNGGLKSDLTYILGQSSLSDFRTALQAAYGTPAIAPASPTATSANPLLNSTGTVYATLPSDPSGGSYASIFKTGSTWEQLWSFCNMGNLSPAGVFDSSGKAVPRLNSAVQHGLTPLVVHAKMFYRLRIGDGGTDHLDPDGVNRTDPIYVDSIPVILLANPYAVPLAARDYQFRFGPVNFANASIVFGNTDNTANPGTDFTAATGEPGWGYGAQIFYVLRTTGMAPGEAQIFTIDPAANAVDSEDRVLVTGPNSTQQVVMKNDYDPVPAITYNSGFRIPAGKTRAALRLQKSALGIRLFMDYTPAAGDRSLVQFIYGQNSKETGGTAGTTSTPSASYTSTILVVDPMTNGTRQGGGYNIVINQPPTTDYPASTAANPVSYDTTLFSYQQAPFCQVNYRAMINVSNATNTGYPHPLEWARRFYKNGSTGSSGDNPNPWLASNLMRPSGGTTTSRWGIVTIGEGQNQTLAPASIGGTSASDVGFSNPLYDIPRPDRPISSLGHLQHFNTTGFVPDTTYQTVSIVNSWMTNYALANSYPQPHVPRDKLFFYTDTTSLSSGYHVDGSYLWNDLLWDRFTFSTYPQKGSFDFAADKLVNDRYRPFRDRVSVPWNDPARFRGDGNPATAANSRLAAENLLVEGAFNINSTSVEAWKAVFSSLKNVPVGTETATAAPFPRILSPAGGSAGSKTGSAPNSWTGFRDLSRDEIQSLAEEMVMQVRKRGPFLSLAEFVNRRLIDSASDTYGLGLSGALQAALDKSVNLPANIAAPFRVTAATNSTTFNDPAYVMANALAGFPGYVLQGDVLSPLGSSIAPRSDTFTIRAYGDAASPATGEVTGRAWCEAVVQRLPDYVNPDTASGGNLPRETPVTGSDNEKFGRRFQLVGFRWLTSSDI